MTTASLIKLLSPAETSSLLGVTQHTLAVWRCNKRHDLEYVKVGNRVRYRSAAVEAFIARNTVQTVAA